MSNTRINVLTEIDPMTSVVATVLCCFQCTPNSWSVFRAGVSLNIQCLRLYFRVCREFERSVHGPGEPRARGNCSQCLGSKPDAILSVGQFCRDLQWADIRFAWTSLEEEKCQTSHSWTQSWQKWKSIHQWLVALAAMKLLSLMYRMWTQQQTFSLKKTKHLRALSLNMGRNHIFVKAEE